MLAGVQAAIIERIGQSLYPLAPKPQYMGKDLVEIANAIIGYQKTARLEIANPGLKSKQNPKHKVAI